MATLEAVALLIHAKWAEPTYSTVPISAEEPLCPPPLQQGQRWGMLKWALSDRPFNRSSVHVLLCTWYFKNRSRFSFHIRQIDSSYHSQDGGPRVSAHCFNYLRQQRWTEVMFSSLSVCLWAGYLKKIWTDLNEILWTGRVCDKDKLVRFWWTSRSSEENFLILYVILRHWKMGPKTIYSMIFK